MPQDWAMSLATKVREDLSGILGNDYLRDYEVGKHLCIEINRQRVVDVAKHLTGNLEGRLVHITPVDLGVDGFKVIYNYGLDHLETEFHVNVAAVAPREDPVFPSITPITYQASWAEREAKELFGLEFKGHPDPRHLFLPYEWAKPLQSNEGGEIVVKSAAPWETESSSKARLIPIGPYHPSLLEGGYFRIEVDGEEIVDVDLKAGFNHRGIMKLLEGKNYNRCVYLVERICGFCSTAHTLAFVNTTEALLGIKTPDRAKYIRTLLAELNRIHSHLLWIGIIGDLTGFKTLFMWAWRLREAATDAVEMISGNRVFTAMNVIGGARRDIPNNIIPKIAARIDELEDGIDRMVEMIHDHGLFRCRTDDVGILHLATAKDGGAVGPTARGSGWKIDVRLNSPYAAYGAEYTTWDAVVETGKDVWARTQVRLQEVSVSADICRQCLDALKRVKKPFKLEDLKEPPEGELLGKVEAPRGELAYYLVSDSTHIPYAVRIRTPSYRNVAILPFLLRGYTIADAPVIIGSVDPCFACTDRVTIVDEGKGKETTILYDQFIHGRFKG